MIRTAARRIFATALLLVAATALAIADDDTSESDRIDFVVGFLIFFRVFCGIFIIQPIGAIPEGATIVYWRSGLNVPFIASADGLLVKSGVRRQR